MFRFLFVFFVVVPIIEIAVLMQVGSLLGTWPTVALVIISAWLGAKYVRQQGLATLQAVQTKTAQGEMPSAEIVTGLMLLISGVLLVTPGFVTDAFGLSLLIPSVRAKLSAGVQQALANQATMSVHSSGFNNTQGHSGFQFHQSFHSQQTNQFDQDGFQPAAKGQAEPKSNKQHQGDVFEGEYERKE
ncbi:FxsA family protein [Endozoicomonas sp. G2_1]|uniref:FxsA family protein n=1 Tax=Endozoicomonas sp. G2_1 TaxID=2821091 RepID=UPI001ADA0627|nr:FxsA family protein [Endozoicomonas sp. G2_1]MBO9489658.1 FxsA family protein [Endozoicomonas sp. G2_1]